MSDGKTPERDWKREDRANAEAATRIIENRQHAKPVRDYLKLIHPTANLLPFGYVRKRGIVDQEYVYFFKAGDAVKIGRSNDPAKRRAILQTGNPAFINVLGVIPGDVEAEKHIHYELRNFRCAGEWFRWCPDVEEYITEVLKHE